MTMPAGGGVTGRPPTREELDTKVTEAQQRLAELKRAQEELERERAALEEGKRRRAELEMGKTETAQNLIRGIELVEKREFDARREAEQLGKTLIGLREVLGLVEGIREESWTSENWNAELTRALAAVENARMEWNAARLKWPFLGGPGESAPGAESLEKRGWPELSFWKWCQLGVALTWPIALVALIGFVVIFCLLWK